MIYVLKKTHDNVNKIHHETMELTTQQFHIAVLIIVSRSCALMLWRFQFCECPVHSLDLIPAPQLNQRSISNPRLSLPIITISLNCTVY